ncbi:MAG TPA: exodeoxyribonuclease VII large subunit, partial [Firmicutes bacterium]|nr:exodeoxyribonuclease VII large subunit [Bacillota bacterium]
MDPITVSDLTAKIKEALDSAGLANIAVIGEISNFIHHSSGHMYFSLKDEASRIKAVMFRSRNQRLNFVPQNGDTLIAFGSIGVYEARGEYQLYVEALLPKGIGELHLAFEKLKSRLAEEGLFAAERKLPLPFLPAKIGVITSPTGAAVRDICQILNRRFPGVEILIIPALVQGKEAPASIKAALGKAQLTGADVLIVGRGGGSFEELSAFNDEEVARAIFASKIPVISAVGHETDFTIADFVADLRAPTPSAAAELAVPVKSELKEQICGLKERLAAILERKIKAERRHLGQLAASAGLKRPQDGIRQLRQRVDELWTGLAARYRYDLAVKNAGLSAAAA